LIIPVGAGKRAAAPFSEPPAPAEVTYQCRECGRHKPSDAYYHRADGKISQYRCRSCITRAKRGTGSPQKCRKASDKLYDHIRTAIRRLPPSLLDLPFRGVYGSVPQVARAPEPGAGVPAVSAAGEGPVE
jgi:hypothetical protein